MDSNVDLNNIYNRTEMLLGSDKLNVLKSSKVLLLGIGGVGSFVLEALARVGIMNITIVDKDIVDITNINRQIIATTKTIGMYKVNVAKERVLNINPNITVTDIKLNLNSENISNIIDDTYDYVIDCIDDFKAKISVIEYCYDNNIKIISSMGMANKLNPLNIKVSDIFKTSQCKLAKKVRKTLKELHIEKLKVVYSVEETKEILTTNNDGILGSVSFVPSVAGLIIASEIVKDLVGI